MFLIVNNYVPCFYSGLLFLNLPKTKPMKREEQNRERINQELRSQVEEKDYRILKIEPRDLINVYDLNLEMTEEDIQEWVKEHLLYHSN